MFRDPDFGLVNLRVFGSYRWRVGSPDNFINQFVGTFGAVATPDVENRLREQMVILVYNTLGKMKDQGTQVTDLASSLTTIEQAVLGAAPQHFSQFGIELNQLQGLSINLPDEVQKAVNTRSKMGVLGVNYMQYQAGQALTTAAANPSGGAGAMAGAGVGLGAGLGMGYGMAGQMQGMYQQGPSTPCPKCGTLVPAGDPVLSRMRPGARRSCRGTNRRSVPEVRTAGPGRRQVLPQLWSLDGAPGTPHVSQVQSPVPGPSKFCPNCGAAMPP